MTNNEAQKPKGKKATKAEITARVATVHDMLIGRARRRDILQHASKSGWDVTPRQIDSYIARANEQIAKESEIDRTLEFGKARATYELIIKRALNISDFNTMLRTQIEVCKLFGLYPEPPPKTLRILGIDEGQLQALGKALQDAGKDPATVFNAMLKALAEDKNRER